MHTDDPNYYFVADLQQSIGFSATFVQYFPQKVLSSNRWLSVEMGC
jgi:hypothetical protein